jgi:hypothetical protein
MKPTPWSIILRRVTTEGPYINERMSVRVLTVVVVAAGRVSKFMNGFRKKGFVRYNGGLQINGALIATFLQSRPLSVTRKA